MPRRRRPRPHRALRVGRRSRGGRRSRPGGPTGEVLVVLGPNGAGKTSTVEALEGYRRPSSGHISVFGLDPMADHHALTGRVGVMLQRGGVYPMLGPRRVLDLFAGYYPDPLGGRAARSRRAARRGHHALAPPLGRRATAALPRPGADRPAAGGLPRRADGRRRPRGPPGHPGRGGRPPPQGVCVVLTTHELAEAERMADRIVILSAGRVVLEGTPHGLTAASRHHRDHLRCTAGTRHDLAGRGARSRATVTETRARSLRRRGRVGTGGHGHRGHLAGGAPRHPDRPRDRADPRGRLFRGGRARERRESREPSRIHANRSSPNTGATAPRRAAAAGDHDGDGSCGRSRPRPGPRST